LKKADKMTISRKINTNMSRVLCNYNDGFALMFRKMFCVFVCRNFVEIIIFAL